MRSILFATSLVLGVCAIALGLPEKGSGGALAPAGNEREPLRYWIDYGDFDFDGDVDKNDFEVFQSCFNGPNRPPALPDCSGADANRDGSVDLVDYAEFAARFNGPNRVPGVGVVPIPQNGGHTPEPFTVALVAAAMGGLALKARRRSAR